MNKRSFILQETSRWQEEGIITEEQQKQIVSRYPEKEKLHSMPILAAILIGLGVLTFIASNWQELGALVKIAIIFISLLLAYGGGEIFRRKGYERVGIALTVIGVIIFGAGFFLIGQIYQLSANPVNAFYLWFLGAASMAWHYRNSVLSVLSLLILSASAIYGAVEDYRDTVTMLIFYFLFVAGIVPFMVRYPSRLMIVTSLLLLFGISSYDLHVWDDYMVYPGLFLSYLLISQLLPRRFSSIQGILRVLGYAAVTLFAIILIFDMPDLMDSSWDRNWFSWSGTLLVAIGYVYWVIRSRKLDHLFDLMPVLTLLGLFLPGVSISFTDPSVWLMLALFLFTIGMIWSGERHRDITRINLGAVLFGVTCFVGYVNLAWDFLDKSLFFLLGGFLLLALSFLLERKRRQWVREAKEGEE